MTSHPEVAMITSYMGKFVTFPHKSHYACLLYIVGYLKYAVNKCICFTRGSSLLEGYADSDWAGDTFTRYSRIGLVWFSLGGPIVWASKLGKRIARSTCEAEYYALGECVAELYSLLDIFEELDAPTLKPVTINDDCTSVEAVTKGQARPHLARHVDLDYRFVQDAYNDNMFKLRFIDGTANVADIFTKYKAYTVLEFEQYTNILLAGRSTRA